MNRDMLNAIAVWVIRIILIIGFLVCAISGKESAAYGIGSLAFLSFIFLEP